MLAVTGLAPDEEASFSHVTLLGAEGENLKQVWLNSSTSSPSPYSVEELVGWVDSVPRVPFCVRLTGRDSRGNTLERVSTEMVQPTHVQIQVVMPNKTWTTSYCNAGQNLSAITGKTSSVVILIGYICTFLCSVK